MEMVSQMTSEKKMEKREVFYFAYKKKKNIQFTEIHDLW